MMNVNGGWIDVHINISEEEAQKIDEMTEKEISELIRKYVEGKYYENYTSEITLFIEEGSNVRCLKL